MNAARHVGNMGKVIAFEGSPALVDFLAYHKRVNRFEQLKIVPKVVSDLNADGVPFFLVNDGFSFRNSLTIGAENARYISVNEKTKCEIPSTTLDRYVDESGDTPDMIKIDVEGAELLVLRGAERLLSEIRPYLVVGLHPYWLPESQTSTDIFDLLKAFRYEIVDEHLVPFEGGDLGDYLCAPGRKRQ
jgi:FkbM family methyltransferase